MKTFVTPASPLSRVTAFIEAYRLAPNDTDIEMRLGRTESRKAAVMVSVGASMHAFTVSEARSIANILEETLQKFPTAPESAGFPDLILALRATADKSEQAMNH